MGHYGTDGVRHVRFAASVFAGKEVKGGGMFEMHKISPLFLVL